KIREVPAEVEGSAAALIEDSKTTRLQAERAKRDLATLDLGRKVGDFVLAEKLGEGGFGEVYRAIRPVAIKFARDETSVERLRRFADLQAKVDSPRIVKPLEIDLSAERPYVVMELVDGPNLRSLIRSGGLEPKDALAIAKEIALALSDAHAAGVSHLDLKPENVLVGGDGSDVLSGDAGSSLAFGPGHMFGTAIPGEPGLSIVAGHRDTHFAFLQHISVGDLLSIENRKVTVNYRIVEKKIADIRHRTDTGIARKLDIKRLTLQNNPGFLPVPTIVSHTFSF
ncbi:MAG TPA: sortase, partial [Sneathiellales bacterium]|nr:sortase [Sneathiellales bacterium]